MMRLHFEKAVLFMIELVVSSSSTRRLGVRAQIFPHAMNLARHSVKLQRLSNAFYVPRDAGLETLTDREGHRFDVRGIFR